MTTMTTYKIKGLERDLIKLTTSDHLSCGSGGQVVSLGAHTGGGYTPPVCPETDHRPTPAPLAAVSLGGQKFTLVRYEPYTNKKGKSIPLAVWEAECAEDGCSNTFEVKCPAHTGLRADRRRCDVHRRPGVKAKFARSRKRGG